MASSEWTLQNESTLKVDVLALRVMQDRELQILKWLLRKGNRVKVTKSPPWSDTSVVPVECPFLMGILSWGYRFRSSSW